MLNCLETERRELAREARRLREENERLLRENERLREEVTIARLSRKLGFFAYRAVRTTKATCSGSDEAETVPGGRSARRFYRRLPPSFTFGEFIRAAEAAGIGPRRAKKILLAQMSEGAVHLKGDHIQKRKAIHPVLRLRRTG